MDERLSLNRQLQKAFENPKKNVNSLLKHKTNAFLESYVSEHYIAKKMAEDCVIASYNWWVGTCNGVEYAIHIDDSVKEIDKNFSKKLEKIGYKIIFVNINYLEQKISFIYEEEAYELEILVEKLKLTPKDKIYKLNTNVNNEVFDWCYKHLDFQKIIYDGAIEILFLSKYFNYLTNLDVVWANKINGNITFFIGEVKFKSKNKNNVFIMNIGEKKLYEKIVKNTDIQVVSIALICSKEDRQATLIELMELKDFPIFYMQLKERTFDNLFVQSNNVSEFGKQNGQYHQNTVEFPFQMFERVVDFGEIGKIEKSFIRKLNKMLMQNSNLLYGNKLFCQKHIAKFYALLDMESKGLEIKCDDYLKKEYIKENILNVNGYKVLFKFVESSRAWNVTLMEKEYNLAKEKGVDFVLVYQNVSNGKDIFFNLNEINKDGKTFYLVDESTSKDAIKVLGFISFSVFDEYKHCLPAGISKIQKNYYAIRGINGYTINMENDLYKSDQDTYFLQLLGWQRSGIDKEPSECQLQEYDKMKELPFASSYIYY